MKVDSEGNSTTNIRMRYGSTPGEERDALCAGG